MQAPGSACTAVPARAAVLCLAAVGVGACRPVAMAPLPEPGAFTGVLEDHVGPLDGRARYARCGDVVHVFLNAVSTPPASIIIHPMGSPVLGRHPLRHGTAIDPRADPARARTVPGPYYLEAVLPPEQVLESDSGFVEFRFLPTNDLRGRVEAWLRDPGAGRTAGTGRSHLRLTATFVARRDTTLEPGLRDRGQCAR